jgi:DNA-binding FadR family transcriptional regulator
LFVGGELDAAVVRSILEVRQLVGPMVAGLAAERATPGAVEELGGILDELSAATDDIARQRIALQFWDRIVDAADSIALRLMFNALRDAYEPVMETTGPILHDEVTALGDYQSVVNAIAARDRAVAEDAAAALLARGSEGLARLLERLASEET